MSGCEALRKTLAAPKETLDPEVALDGPLAILRDVESQVEMLVRSHAGKTTALVSSLSERLHLVESSIDCPVDPRYAEWSRQFAVHTVNNRLKRIESAAASNTIIIRIVNHYKQHMTLRARASTTLLSLSEKYCALTSGRGFDLQRLVMDDGVIRLKKTPISRGSSAMNETSGSYLL